MPSSLEKQLLLFLLLINALFAAAFLLWQSRQEEKAVIEQMKLEARGIYHYVVLTRQLITKWEGVYIRRERRLERKTPSGFTKALADLGQARGAPFSIKLAFDGNIDPDHSPDAFEQKAIDLMQKNFIREAWEITEKDNHHEFRYAGPLVFNSDCTSCHAGSSKSGVIGCITVRLHDADKFFSTLTQKNMFTALYLTGAFGVIILLLWALLNRFVLIPLRKLDAAARLVEKGDLHVEVNLSGSREWQSVGRNFNNMVHALARQQAILREEVKKAVSGMQAAYNELKRTEQYRADFFTNITHDLKTPITAMKGALTLLERKHGEEYSPYLDILQRNCSKLASMVQDILDCARLESGSLELDMGPADMAELIEDTILMAMPLAWDKDTEIRYQVPEHKCMAMIDTSRMEQVMANLLSNAVKFSPSGSAVAVSIEMESTAQEGDSALYRKFWLISVRDRGQGIPSDRIDMVFNKFYQCSRKGGPEGLGLGLSIVKGIVEMHGGKVGVRARAGGGTCFYFSVPVLEQED